MEEIGIIDAIKDEALPRGESAKSSGADTASPTYDELDTDDLYVRCEWLIDQTRIRIGSGFNDLCGFGIRICIHGQEKNALFLNFLNIFIAKR
jgi:hypothetical protein